jgi:hypothetical protein
MAQAKSGRKCKYKHRNTTEGKKGTKQVRKEKKNRSNDETRR